MSTITTRAVKGSLLTYTEVDTNFTNLNNDKMEKSTPVLAGNLDVATYSITTTTTNGNIVIEPNGTGDVHLVTDALRVGDLNTEARISTYGTGNLVLTTNEGNDPDPTITIGNGANANITITPTGTGYIVLDGVNWPAADGTANYILKTDGAGQLSWTANALTASKATNLVGGNGTTLLGSIPYQSATDTTSLLSPNTTTTNKFLAQVGDGTNGMAPMWQAITTLDNVMIGSATANTGRFTNLTVTGSVTAGGGTGTSGQVLQSTGSGVQWATASGGGNNIILIHSGQEYITITSTGTSESWTLATAGGISGVSVSTNTFTLPAGTYFLELPFTFSNSTTGYDFKLRNTTDSVDTALITSNQMSMSGVNKYAYWAFQTHFTIAASKTFRFQTTSNSFQANMGYTTNGLYTVKIMKY
jgi:hypothetical protein